MSEAYLVESEESNLDLNEKDSRHYGLSRKTCMLKKSLKSIIQKPRFMEILHKQILVMFQESTSLQEDSLARTSQMLERELVSRGVVLHFGNITWKRLGFFDQSTQSLRTFQQSLVEDSMLSLVTLPRSGMMQNGIVFQLPALVHYTVETESSSFPTPTVADTFTDNLKSSQQKEGSRHSVNLSQAVQMWRTPTSRIGGGRTQAELIMMGERYRPSGHLRQISLEMQVNMMPTPNHGMYRNLNYDKEKLKLRAEKHQIDLAMKIQLEEDGGQLNPVWVEWLMGFPQGWTELSVSEMQSFHNSLKLLREQSKNMKKKEGNHN